MKYLLQTRILSLEFNPSNVQMELVWQRVAGANYHKVRVWGNMISKYESENKIVKLKHPQGEHGDPEID